MGTNTQSESDTPDTDARIDAKTPTTDRPSDTANTAIPAFSDSAIGHNGRSRFFDTEFDGTGDDFDGFVSDVTTIVQSQCERATDYADIDRAADPSVSASLGHRGRLQEQKHFMVWTTSTERNYRCFNFAFACVLYNVWRLVDLLVKLALDGEYSSYAPRVDANYPWSFDS